VTRRPPGKAPRLRLERELWDGGGVVVAGADEVGRGCLSGPVTVGVVIVDPDRPRPPRGLRDSKLLAPQARFALVGPIRRWVLGWAVGHAEAAEIDAYGLIAALRLAGHRALRQLPDLPDWVLLDGNHDYLTPPAQLALDWMVPGDALLPRVPAVRTQVKADLTCASVAAASVLAKTSRDALMVELSLEHPEYAWDVNKGYATPYHRAALREHGPTAQHRLSWHLGAEPDDLDELEIDELAETERSARLVPADALNDPRDRVDENHGDLHRGPGEASRMENGSWRRC
jgi:ribonuclease HII